MRLFIFFSIALFLLTPPVMAESRAIESAGEAISAESVKKETDVPYVDIYQRTFKYKDSDADFRAKIEARRDHYNDARNDVIDDYRSGLQAPQ